MKIAIISAKTGPRPSDLRWTWRSSEESEAAPDAASFPYYYDCVEDARQHGYHVQPTVARGATAPGAMSLKRREGAPGDEPEPSRLR